MSDFINSILSLSRAGRYSGSDEEYDCPVGTIARAIANDIASAHADVDADIKIDDLPNMNIHDDDITHIFQNLISNAFKYRNPSRKLKLRIGCEASDRFVKFYVADNGRGIDPSEKDRVFEVFYRGANVGKGDDYLEGTGVGLTVVKKAVEKSRGKIWLESTPGAGTTFFFVLPR
jgi:signal transduction histidine kinase